MVLLTVMVLGPLVGILVSRAHETAAYRDQSAPSAVGTVTSVGARQHHMTCGRSADGFTVDVTYAIDGVASTMPLPTCHPSLYPLHTRVQVWERTSSELTLESPQRAAHVFHLFAWGLAVLWLALMVVLAGLERRRLAGRADLVAQ